jgi:hypothetical protein
LLVDPAGQPIDQQSEQHDCRQTADAWPDRDEAPRRLSVRDQARFEAEQDRVTEPSRTEVE